MFNVMWLATHEDFHLLAVTGTASRHQTIVVFMHIYIVQWCHIVNIFTRYDVKSWWEQYSEQYVWDFSNFRSQMTDDMTLPCLKPGVGLVTVSSRFVYIWLPWAIIWLLGIPMLLIQFVHHYCFAHIAWSHPKRRHHQSITCASLPQLQVFHKLQNRTGCSVVWKLWDIILMQ